MSECRCNFQGCPQNATRRLRVVIGPIAYGTTLNLCDEHFEVIRHEPDDCVFSLEIRGEDNGEK